MSDDNYDDIIHHPHDGLFKRVFGEKTSAIEHFRAFLPQRVLDALDLDRLKPIPGSFVDRLLGKRHSDLLFSVPAPEHGTEVLLYMLFEHQRSNEPFMALKLLSYMARIWDYWSRNSGEGGGLPPIVPMVLYHGKERWTGPVELLDLLSGGDELKALLAGYLPCFRYELLDLGPMRDQQLKGTVRGQTTLVMFKYIDEPDLTIILQKTADLLQAEFRDPGLSSVDEFLYYLKSAHAHSTQEELERGLRKYVGPEAEEVAMSIASKLMRKGREEGREEGRAEGREEGRAKLLKLAARFFSVDELEELERVQDLDELSRRVMRRVDERLAE